MPHDVLKCSNNALQDFLLFTSAMLYTVTSGYHYTESSDNRLCRPQQASSIVIAKAETKEQSQLL